MRSYDITVNGKTYQVDVQPKGAVQVSSDAHRVPAPVQRKAAPAPPLAAHPTPKPSEPTAAPLGGSARIEAPMPGNILAVSVAVNDKVANNQTLCILEAMKMENEINSPVAGTVTSVHVAKGDTVDTGKLLFTIN